MKINIEENVRLELTAKKHAQFLYDAVNDNREHLSVFLPWIENMQSVDDFENYVKSCESLYKQEKEVSFVIILNEKLVGRIGLHHLNLQNKNGAIGYWLIKDAEGQGIISKCCKKLIDYGFNELGLNRIEIKCASENNRSQAIPQRFNFTKEGIMRQAEFVNESFLDIILYSILKSEWTLNKTNR
ncbi:GNAT family N-acetyltransferase [Chryseobacterium sp. SNU WT5]|uniref:GNAT family N-acetyltransferase n=1 Tax=Chryseobacterium sp. SNU WT5 TaxID=2594269 RepID=UPI0011801E46|nr:GNAT family protein [Chryseobacterium sp. SNU WT5]QDP84271.1 GNAT family N-acetyltransferase [Chryseobacterium sp. SNU WT5]